MPRYGMPGSAITRGGALRRGFAALVVGAVIGTGAVHYAHTRPDGRVRVQVLTTRIGGGIGAGSAVELDGVPAGRIDGIEVVAPGRQRLTLALTPAAAAELTDTFALRFSPGNLFGVSRIALRPGPGGHPLRDGTVIDLSATGRVVDATMGRLLEQLAATAGQLATPELTSSLNRLSTELDSVAPLLQVIVATTRTVVDGQRYAPSYLIAQYASALQGMASLLGGSVTLLESFSNIPVLREDRALFDRSVDIITEQIVPSVGRAGSAAQRAFGPYSELVAPLLRALAATVPAPGRSATEIRQLLDRLDSAFTDGPGGPVLNVEVALRGVPAVAVPLLGAGGGR
ncbi:MULTISPECIES: MlaD family protein [unclassified Nocardia]|uniref:MlaD family protein n=1 Tax=unclassified Nocardia TaxID=2637762 RepID=UPI001CE43DD2|nr:MULTISPECIES: MlaD family protein [unclassified Nocardia]